MSLERLLKVDSPAIPIRAVHLDLKGVPPTASRLLALLKVFSAVGYNTVVVEWEDAFPWTVDARFRSETAYMPEDVARFCRAADELGLEIIPKVQCLGHMETPLSVPGYEHLREIPHRSDVLNPLAPGGRELVEGMVEDVLALMPGVRHFHLGGDEADTFGRHPDTKAYVQKHGKSALYLHHVEPILDKLIERNIRPLLWHDMMIDWDRSNLQALGKKADLVVWGYHGHPDITPSHYNTKYIEKFRENGIVLWGAGSYKSGDGGSVDLPDYAQRQANALAWVEIATRYGFKGLIATGWSRNTTHCIQKAPIDSALDCLLNVGVIFHDGHPLDGGRDACVKALDDIGERERFEACWAVMQKLASARHDARVLIWNLHEHLVMATLDARRRGSVMLVTSLEQLREVLAAAEAAAGEMRAAFAGLIPPIWIERYLRGRIDAIREEFRWLSERVRRLNREGYEAVLPTGPHRPA